MKAVSPREIKTVGLLEEAYMGGTPGDTSRMALSALLKILDFLLFLSEQRSVMT